MNSDFKFLTTERHKGKKNLRSSSHKLLKKTQKNEKSQQLGSFQNNEIARLNKEKLDLEAYVVYLKSKIKKLGNLPARLKEKEKTISKLKKSIKKSLQNPSLSKEKKLKISVSHRNTPKVKKIDLKNFDPEYNKQQSRTISSLPLTCRNSQTSFYSTSLQDIFFTTEKYLKQWEDYYLKTYKLHNS